MDSKFDSAATRVFFRNNFGSAISDADRLIENDEPILIKGIAYSTDDAILFPVEFTDNEDNPVIAITRAGGAAFTNRGLITQITLLADKGLRLPLSGTMSNVNNYFVVFYEPAV